MSYTKTNWQNLPSTSTPLNATNLNKIEIELEYLQNVENFANRVTLNENPLYSVFKRCGELITINYEGESKANGYNDVIAIIPEGYRPPSNIAVPFVKSNGAYGIINIFVDGKIAITTISSTTFVRKDNIFSKLFCIKKLIFY